MCSAANLIAMKYGASYACIYWAIGLNDAKSSLQSLDSKMLQDLYAIAWMASPQIGLPLTEATLDMYRE